MLYSEKIPPRPHTNNCVKYGKVCNNISGHIAVEFVLL